MRRGWGTLLSAVLFLSLSGCGPSRSGTDREKQIAQAYSLDARQVGDSGRALLQAQPYSKLIVEIASASGRALERDTIDFLRSFLQAHVRKPGGIRIVEETGLHFENSDPALLEERYRKFHTGDDTISIFIVVPDGKAVDELPGTRIFGRAYFSNSIALFKDTIISEAIPIDTAVLEKVVIAHEIGHLFGLVNSGAPLAAGDHYDHENSTGHCKNPTCLMHYAVYPFRSPLAMRGLVPEFDADCTKDLQANGGR